MQIAIIGSGNVGKALAGSFTRAGHDVTLTASNPDHAREAAAQSGGRAAESNREAVAAAELVVLAVHYPLGTASWPSWATRSPARWWST
jgi:8-hydroxy-5-deazaflavin:NADPH oxidoreductase